MTRTAGLKRQCTGSTGPVVGEVVVEGFELDARTAQVEAELVTTGSRATVITQITHVVSPGRRDGLHKIGSLGGAPEVAPTIAIYLHLSGRVVDDEPRRDV